MRTVTIGGTGKRIALPDGRVHSSGDVVTLTDEQWARVPVDLIGTLVLDGGSTSGGAAPLPAQGEATSGSQASTLVMGVRRDADTVPAGVDDGDAVMLALDEEGRLKVAGKPASTALVTGNITANGQSVACDVRQVSNIVMHCKGTFSGANCTFEASLDSTNGTDGTWFSIQAVRSNANTVETTTGVLAAAPAYSWEMSVNAYAWVRVRATAFVSGTQTWMLQKGSYATEPIPAVQSHGITGSVTVSPAGGNAYSAVTAASTNAAVVKNSSGAMFEITASNPTATPAYVKLYNKASAPTVGTDVPVVTIPVAANSFVSAAFGNGKRFSTGIAIAVTGAIGATDTTSAVVGVQVHATYL